MAGRLAFMVMVGFGHTNLLSREFSPDRLVPGASGIKGLSSLSVTITCFPLTSFLGHKKPQKSRSL